MELFTTNAAGTVLIIAAPFPPIAAAGTFRTIRFVKYLPASGWNACVVSVVPNAASSVDASLLKEVPSDTVVTRASRFRPFSELASLVRRLLAEPIQRVTAPKLSESDQHPSSKRAEKSAIRRVFSEVRQTLVATPDDAINWILPALRAGLKKFRQHRPLVIFSTGPPHSTHLTAILLKIATGLPAVIDLRDPWARKSWGGSDRGNAIQRKLQRCLEALCVRHANHVILNTPALLEDFRAAYPPRFHAKFHVISNGFDPEHRARVEQAMKKRRCLQPDVQMHLCHPGTVYGDRDLRPLLGALRQLHNAGISIRFEQIGFVQDAVGLQSYIKKLGLTDKVDLRDRLPHDETLQHMASADAFVISQPGTATQIPGKLYEMLIFCKPIIALAESEGATAELIRRLNLGLVVSPLDDKEIAEAIRTCAAGHCAGTANAGWQKALAEFDGQELTKRLAAILDSCVSRATQTPI